MNQQKRIALALEIDEPYPQHQEVYAGIQEYVRNKPAWHCLIDEHPGFDARRRGEYDQPYDGVIARATPQLQQRCKRMNIPLVNTHFQQARPGLAGVYVDGNLIGRLAAEHLLERGFRRLSVLTDLQHKHTRVIAHAFEQRAAESEIDCAIQDVREQPFRDARSWLDLEKALMRWLDSMVPPVGVFVETAANARLVLELTQARGWHVPQDIAILSQQDLKSIVNVSPQISATALNYNRTGYEAARLLDDILSGKAKPDQEIYVPPSGVVARESTDYFAVQDAVVAEALAYISAHLSGSLRLSEIADALAISPRSLQLRFDQALGRGISEEIRRLRLVMAKRLLAEHNQSIGGIAKQVGFASPQVMSQVFRRAFGMTPSAYRKQISGD